MIENIIIIIIFIIISMILTPFALLGFEFLLKYYQKYLDKFDKYFSTED